MQRYADGDRLDESLFADEATPVAATNTPNTTYANGDNMDASLFADTSVSPAESVIGNVDGEESPTYEPSIDEPNPLKDFFVEGAKGAGRAVKAIGKGFVGLASGAARLAGTPIRAVSGWDGLHRLADSIDSGYDNWGADTLASEYGFDQETNIGTVGEKIAGLSGTLGSLALGGAVANATKLPMAVRAGGVALQKSLPWMFGNDAAVRTYDTAKQTAEANGEEFNRARALGLASVNGAIHYFGFKLFENQSLNKMLGMPQSAELAMPGFANAAREGGAKTFSGIVDGVRNGLVKHVVAERAKGALKAGGIMGVQNFLSSLPQQAAEGRDIDWYEALKAGAEGVEEGAFMEGLMGGAAILRSRAAARKFTADTYFREGYTASNGEHVPGLLHTPEGRQFIMKQSPDEQARILDIVSHGGKVSKAELDAACLPPDMKPDELKEFAKDWRKDLADEWDRAAEPEAIGDNEELDGNDDVIPREQQMRNRAKVNEAHDRERRLADAEDAQRVAADEQAADDAAVAAEEAKYREANARADAERQAEADGAEQLALEEAYRRTEAMQDAAGARGETGAADVPSASPDAPQGAEAASGEAVEVVDRPNRLRRQQPNNFRHPGDNRLRPAVPDINQRPIRETGNETGNGADEAPAQPVAQVSGRDGRQPPPEAGARPLEGAAARAEAADAGVVEPDVDNDIFFGGVQSVEEWRETLKTFSAQGIEEYIRGKIERGVDDEFVKAARDELPRAKRRDAERASRIDKANDALRDSPLAKMIDGYEKSVREMLPSDIMEVLSNTAVGKSILQEFSQLLNTNDSAEYRKEWIIDKIRSNLYRLVPTKSDVQNTGVVEPISAKKMRAMKYENVIALPDSWQKYSELQSRLMRTGDKGGVSVESPAGKQIKAEMERMDADGWGELYRAHMKWAGADKKTRGEHPPDTLEAFKEWQAAKSSAPTVPTEQKSETQTAEKLRDAMKGDNVLKKIDAAYKKAKTDAERNALKERFATRVAELRKQLEKAADSNRLRNAAGEDPLAARGQPARKDGSATAAQSAGKMADRFLSLVDKISDERKRGIEAERKVKTDDEFSHLYDANWKRQQAGWDALKAEIDALSADELSALSDALYSRASGFPGSRERAELRQQLREYVVNAWRENSNAASAENVSPQATSKNDAAPSNSDVAARATWTDRGGTTHVLDGFNAPSSDNVAKGAHVAVRHDNGVLYQGEIVGIGPKNVKVKTRSDMYGETVLTFPRKDIVGVRSQADHAQQNTESAEGNDVSALTAKAQALAAEYAALPDREKVSAKGRDLEQRIAEAWDAVDAAERAENAPVAAPKKTGATTPPKAAKSAEGGKSASGEAPSAPTPEMRRKATAAMRILGADAGKDADALETELRRMEERGQAASGPGRRKAEALRDLAAYKRAVGTKEVSAEEIADGRQRDAEQRIIEGKGDALPSEDFYGRRQSRGKGEMPAKWTDAAKKPLERVARALRNIVTVGGKKLKVSFADRPAEADGQSRKSISGIFTGTAADYANRSRQGGVDDGPSLQKIGTGEGSQVYGWGLYGSSERGVAENYARSAARDKRINQDENTFQAVKKVLGNKTSEDSLQAVYEAITGYNDWKEVKEWLKRNAEYDEEAGPLALAAFRRNESALKKVHDEFAAKENLYEQTFFTNRAEGDESHLLKWYEDSSQSFLGTSRMSSLRDLLRYGDIEENNKKKLREVVERLENYKPVKGHEIYEAVAYAFGNGINKEAPRKASEWFAAHGIDGVKYPVDSFGGKGVKDGDKAGWNYVAFSDEHIRVDHKWNDGELRYMRNGDGEVVGEYDADRGEIRLYPGATVADVVHEFTHPLVDFARAESKAGRGELLGKIKEIIDAERATWEQPVREAYADKGEGEILEEIFTHAMGDKGATLFGKSTTTLEGRRWYNRMWDAIKGVWQDFATKMGWNKADLRGLDEMSPEAAAQKILSEMAKGRSFGDATTGGEGARESRRVSPPGGNGGGATLFSSTSPVDVNEKETFVQKVQRKLQDYRAVIKRTEEKLGITDKGRSLYYALDRVFGKTRDEAHRLAKGKVEPMLRRLVEAGAAMGKRFDATNGAEVGLDDYLYAMHAKERNDVLASRPDARVSVDGSGMSEAKARSILSAFAAMPEAKRRAIEDAAKTVWDINDSRLDRLVESGRMSQDEADGLRRTYRHYVPLRTDMEAMGEDLFNTGTSGWSKSEFRRALGRTTEADSPTVFSLMQAEDAIAGANKNEARQRLYDMVTAHPELGRIRRMDKLTRKWSYTHGEEAWVADERYNERDRDDIVMVKRGGTLYAIELDGSLGKRLAAAVTSRNLARFPDELSIIPKATRTMAEMRTQLVPTFFLRNMKADHLEVFLNSIGDMGFMGASRFLGRMERHFVSADAHKAIQQYFTTGRVDTSTDAGRLFDEYVKTGSLIGGGNRQGYADTATELNDIIDDMVRGKANPRRWGKAAKECVSTLSEHIETGTRFGVYWTCREMGMSPEEAASYSRDLTTNFNRKGEWTPVTNSLFMFSNAAIQGLARASKSMNPKMSKNAYQSLMTIGAIGVLGALWRHFLGSDDERRRKGEGDPSFDTDYDKANYIRFGWGGTSLNLKERYPWAAVKYAAEKLTEFALGDCTKGDLVKGLGENVVVAMLQEPFGHGGTAAQAVTPSVFVPITQMLEGKDFRGEDMYARKFNESKPDSSNGKRSTSGIYKGIAQGLNWLTDGNAYRQGGIDLAPETIKTVAETIGGGVWTDATRITTLLERAYDSMKSGRNEFELRDIPFLGDVVRRHRGPEAKYYEAIEAYDRDKYELKNTKDANVRRELRKDNPYLHTGKSLLDGLIERVKELGHLERGEVKAGQKWVERKTPVSEERKRRFREQRLATQARVLKMLGE